jgi:hypothetical protein
MKTKIKLTIALASLAFAALLPAAPMDGTTLADFDFSDAQKTRTQTLIDNGTLELQRVLTAPDEGYRHMGWPVATRMPDGRTVVLIRNTKSHSGYDDWPDNARRVVYSDDNMATWLPTDALTSPPVLGVNAAVDIEANGNFDYNGMHAISWAYATGTTNPRLVVVTAKDDRITRTPPVTKFYRVYLSDDRGVTWREQPNAFTAVAYDDAVNCGPNLVQHPEFGLVIPFGQPTSTNKANLIARSADAGATWEIRKWTNSAASRSIEPALATWGPGHMVMIGRERDNTYGYDSASGKFYYTQHVYKHTPGTAFSTISFTTARTNIAGNGKTPIAKGKDAQEAHDTAEIIYNPVTCRIEMIQSSRWGVGAENPIPADPENPANPVNSLNIWSIDPVDLLAGGATWRYDGTIVERQGIILGAVGLPKDNKDGFHPGGSIVDTAAGKQHLFIYVGVYTQYANAYRISRPLDTYAFRAACGLPALPSPVINDTSGITADRTLTINGLNFDKDLKEVLIDDKVIPVASSTATTIKIAVPEGITAGGKITVRTDNGIAYAVISALGIDRVYMDTRTPDFITITGAGLSNATKVKFGSLEVTGFATKTDSTIIVRIPDGANLDTITVESASGVASKHLPEGMPIVPHDLSQLNSEQYVVIGKPLDLVAAAQGTPAPDFKWQRRLNDTGAWTDVVPSDNFAGPQSDHLTIVDTNCMNGWQYRYVAHNGTTEVAGNSLTLRLLSAAHPCPSGIVPATGVSKPDLYVSDAQANVILKITQADNKSVVLAGQENTTGATDGSGTAARFAGPRGLTIAASGALIVADTDNSALRSVTATGAVSTIASGASLQNARAVAAHDTNGEVYIADTQNHLIKKMTAAGEVSILAGTGISGTANGPGLSAQFNKPSGIAVDIAGNLYVADTGNHIIRYMEKSTGNVTTFAGIPGSGAFADGAKETAQFNAPEGVIVDVDGRVYVADTGNSLIREIHSGTVRTIAGQLPGIAGFKDGTGAGAWFDSPVALALAEDGNIYVADSGNFAIRRISANDTVTTLPLMPVPDAVSQKPDDGQDGSDGGGGGAPAWYYLAALAALLSTRFLSRKQ